MAVAVQAGPSFRAGSPQRLFEGAYFAGLNGRTYDVSADGTRFLLFKEAAATEEATRPRESSSCRTGSRS